MQNSRLSESQIVTKIIGRNIKYADDTTLIAESGEELKPLIEIER